MRNQSPGGAFGGGGRSMSRVGGRHRSLVRPERSRSRFRNVSRSRTREGGFREHDFDDIDVDGREFVPWYSWWPLMTRILTCCIPSWTLSKCGGMHDERVQAAWREKVALCLIVIVMCLALAFITFGLSIIVCRPPTKPIYSIKMVEGRNTDTERWFLIHGMIYNIPDMYKPYAHRGFNPYEVFATMDISPYFPWTPDCYYAGVRQKLKCRIPGTNMEHCHDPLILNYMEYIADVAYDWDDIEFTTRLVMNGEVLDVGPYLDQVDENNPDQHIFGSYVDSVFRQSIGGDATKALSRVSPDMRSCILQNFRAGFLEVKTIGCIVTDVVLYVSLVAILSLVLAKFFLAVLFSFLMARRLGRPGAEDSSTNQQRLGQKGRSSSSMALKSSRFGAAMSRPYLAASASSIGNQGMRSGIHQGLSFGNGDMMNPSINMDPTTNGTLTSDDFPPAHVVGRYDSTNSPNHMYCILLVTCYSEGEAGLRTTLDSLTETDYDDSQKLLFVIADGIVTGAGNEKSTPDILIGMMELCHDSFDGFLFDELGRPELHSYVAIVEGTKRHNMARVYVGHYNSKGHRVPMVLVVKCGTAAEADKPKPGNRGKRDSQIILMSFLSKVLFDDRMTPLDYDMFFKIYRLTGVMPDQYEAVLMVDADTKVMAPALKKLTCALRADTLVMGMCGETRIANKCSSWVSMIQVFEYFISHHMSKAFESIFGGVTCLPGCFCMYRIKAPKAGGWIPILASPDIVDCYSENITDTLHKKNLLLLGEDRYLTTLMLKTFPKRKQLFVPQAICETIVPDEFSVLLSQRRRWINSTVHNLFELVLVPDLCGTFCCSMQFVVFMEMVGTLVLPAAIVFTGVLIVSPFVGEPHWIPLFLLAAILGLPALLILLSTGQVSYFFWFVVYILALPIWNFVLPVYAFWHFDDFSWGDTRKLDGPGTDAVTKDGGDSHGKVEGRFDSSQIYMKRWHDFEQERLTKCERWYAAGGLAGVNSYVSVRHTAVMDYEATFANEIVGNADPASADASSNNIQASSQINAANGPKYPAPPPPPPASVPQQGNKPPAPPTQPPPRQ